MFLEQPRLHFLSIQRPAARNLARKNIRIILWNTGKKLTPLLRKIKYDPRKNNNLKKNKLKAVFMCLEDEKNKIVCLDATFLVQGIMGEKQY